MASLRSKIEELQREKLEFDKRVQELEDMIEFMSRSGCEFEVEQQQQHYHQHQEEKDEFSVCESRKCYVGADDGQNDNFGLIKNCSDKGVATEQQVGEDEDIHGLHEAISGLRYRNAMDIEYFLNYPCENDAVMESSIDEEIIQGVIVMESSIDEEIIQGVIGTSTDDDHDPDDSYSLPNVSTKEAFQAIYTGPS
ncbi:hypothetical protein WN944_006612 [Citrus x changshan-huyou]|uniref:Uncharacterized protein n=1 Tax=Citrus x changshan-huyou TaxID=2935761 RepID=A0AAP0QU02_9ROSI